MNGGETMNKSLIITFIAVILAVGFGFFAGTKYQQSQRGNFTRQFGNGGNGRFMTGQFPNGSGANRNGFRPVAGEIISADDKSITVKLSDGSSKIIILGNSTKINKASEASRAELKTGEQVSVFGTENSDGSVTAQNIQMGMMLRISSPSASAGK